MSSSSNKSPGPDGLPIDLVKCSPDIWGPLLTNIFNGLTFDTIPKSWSESTIVPIFKKGDKGDAKCYRPISLMDTSVKILWRVIFHRIRSWARENNILHPCQYGFREKLGTIEQCLNLHLITAKYTHVKQTPLYLAFMDLSTAFDSVNRNKLWLMLSGLGLDPALINFMEALHGRTVARVQYGSGGEQSGRASGRERVEAVE